MRSGGREGERASQWRREGEESRVLAQQNGGGGHRRQERGGEGKSERA